MVVINIAEPAAVKKPTMTDKGDDGVALVSSGTSVSSGASVGGASGGHVAFVALYGLNSDVGQAVSEVV